MEAGAAFLLLLLLVLIALAGAAVWALISALRRRKLDAEEDKVDRHMLGAPEQARGQPRPNGSRRAGLGAGTDQDAGGEEEEQERPAHHRVGSEQRIRSIPRR
jgi:hypothetical protein